MCITPFPPQKLTFFPPPPPQKKKKKKKKEEKEKENFFRSISHLFSPICGGKKGRKNPNSDWFLAFFILGCLLFLFFFTYFP